MKHSRIRFSSAPLAERRALFEQAAASWTRVFGVPASDLERYWFALPAREVIVHVLRNDRGEVCGTYTLKHVDVEYRGRPIVIIRAAVAIVPEVRGHSFTLRCVLAEGLRLTFRYPFAESYFFGTVLHPVTYQIVSRLVPRFYPYYDRPQDPALADMAHYLAAHFGYQKPATPHAFVYKDGRAPVVTAEERAYWERKRDPAVRFFLEKCPNYTQGECFIFLAPLPWWLPAAAFGSLAKTWLRRQFGRAHALRH